MNNVDARQRRVLLVGTPEVGSDEAVARTKSWRGIDEAEVIVLGPVGHVPSLFPGADLDVSAMVRDETQRHVEAIAEDLRQSGIRAVAKTRVGVPFVEIIKEVIDSRVDCLIKVSDSENGGVTSSKFGSTDLHLLRKCPCPLWITRSRERPPYARIFVAVDPVDSADQRPGRDPKLDAKVLDWAARVARADGARLTVVHAWQVVGESLLQHGRGRIPAAQFERVLEETREWHERQLAGFVARQDLTGIEQETLLLKGRPSEVISAAVESERANLLVMGTVARTGIRGFFIGNTAEEVIHRVGCAVLAVKPTGFVSPVAAE